jgi:hypothetical protein
MSVSHLLGEGGHIPDVLNKSGISQIRRQDLVTNLMRLSRNKCKYYQRGLRAMELILSAS